MVIAPPHTPGSNWRLSLWPYRSLLRREFVIFMATTAGLISLPLIALLGTTILWGLLPFLAIAFCGLWFALNLSYRRGEVLETLTINTGTVELSRWDRSRSMQEWQCDRHWVTVHLHPTGGPVDNYITLRGNGREVELKRFEISLRHIRQP